MSEVKVFKCVGYMEQRSRSGGERWVSVDDFDRVTAERDALQALLTAANERADTAELHLSIESSKLEQARAMNKRVDVLEGLLRETSVDVLSAARPSSPNPTPRLLLVPAGTGTTDLPR